MEDKKPYKIGIYEDSTGNLVKQLEYSSESEREKAYRGLIRQIDNENYTAFFNEPLA